MKSEYVSFDMMLGIFAGLVLMLVLAIWINVGTYRDGAIAAHKGEYVCKQVPQFVGEPQWQCRSVYGE